MACGYCGHDRELHAGGPCVERVTWIGRGGRPMARGCSCRAWMEPAQESPALAAQWAALDQADRDRGWDLGRPMDGFCFSCGGRAARGICPTCRATAHNPR
jgi:hypothetical protein